MSGTKSLYIHFPFCKHLCNYCDFYKKPLGTAPDFLGLEKGLEKNFDDVEELCRGHGGSLAGLYSTVYLGGGTPSLWDVEGAEFIKDFFSRRGVVLDGSCEFTIEVDPGAWSEKGLKAWSSAGVNRFSIGSQAFDEKFLKVMDRAHDLGEVKRTLSRFRDAKANFSVDLMLGLPHTAQLKRDVAQELKQVLEYGPSHLSVYILKTRSNYPLNEFLPDDGAVSEEYLAVSEYLRSQGFDHYEVSNFALSGRESSHNKKYWSAQTVHALGPNATGFFKAGKNKAFRYQHKPSGGGLTLEELGESELRMEEVYLGLRTNEGLEAKRYFPDSSIEGLAQRWQKRGFLHSFHDGRIVLTPEGYLMIDSIMDDLFSADLV